MLTINGNNTTRDLFKLLNDKTFIDPSEKTIKINPKTKITALNLNESDCLLLFITKQLAMNPEIIIYNGRINRLYISWNTELTELLSHTNNLSKKPSFLLINEFRQSSNLIELVS